MRCAGDVVRRTGGTADDPRCQRVSPTCSTDDTSPVVTAEGAQEAAEQSASTAAPPDHNRPHDLRDAPAIMRLRDAPVRYSPAA